MLAIDNIFVIICLSAIYNIQGST